jgi:hypothetical protein
MSTPPRSRVLNTTCTWTKATVTTPFFLVHRHCRMAAPGFVALAKTDDRQIGCGSKWIWTKGESA